MSIYIYPFKVSLFEASMNVSYNTDSLYFIIDKFINTCTEGTSKNALLKPQGSKGT